MFSLRSLLSTFRHKKVSNDAINLEVPAEQRTPPRSGTDAEKEEKEEVLEIIKFSLQRRDSWYRRRRRRRPSRAS